MLRLSPVSGPLAGRADELGRLREAWQRAVAGTCQLLLLTGEGGVGKTRLAGELACEAEAAGASVLFGGWPPVGAEPCEGLVEALGPVSVPVGAGTVEREALFDAMAAELAVRARRSPVLLVLDDLHRADRSSFLALRHIVERPAGVPVLVLGAYREMSMGRSHPLADFIAAVRDRGNVERLTLDGLSPAAVGELVGDAELGMRVWRQSAGNPLLAGELLRSGALDAPLPATFDDLVAERIGRLEDGTGPVLEAAAVTGQRFTVPVLAAVTGLPQERVRAALRDAAAVGLVVEDPAHPATHRFAHDMVRESLERRMPPEQRLPLHLAVGRALARLRPPTGASPAALAWHFRAGAPLGGSVLAERHAARAGDRAMELLAWDEAAAQYSHALAASRSGPATRAELLLSLGEAQRRAGEPARARQSFLEAASVARRRGDGPRLARAAEALGRVSAVWGDDPALEGLAGEARAMGHDVAVPAAAGRRPVDFSTGDLYDFLEGDEAVAVPSDPPPPAPPVVGRGWAGEAAILRARHLALAGPEHLADRLAAAEDLLRLAADNGDDELAVTGRGWRMLDLLEVGRVAEAAADQAGHAELAARTGPTRHRSDAAAWAAMWSLLEGNADEARAAVDRALVIATAAGDPEAAVTFTMQRWALALEWGSGTDVDEVVDACRNQAATAVTPAEWRASLALLLARTGKLDLAAEELRRVSEGSLGAVARDPRRLHALSCLAEVAWTLGDESHASLLGTLLEPFAGQLVVVGRGVACLGSVARACGLAAAGAHRWDDAESHFRAALDVHRRIDTPALLARTHHDWSQVLAARGRKIDRRRAAESMRKARALADRLKMDRLPRS